MCAGLNNASSSFRICVRYLSERRSSLSQVKRQSCLKATLKPILRISWAWSTRSVPTLAPTAEVVRRDFQERRGGRLPTLLSGADEGKPSLHGEMCATARTHLLGEKRATARPLLLQWSGMCEGATYGKAVPSRLSLLRSAS